MSDLKQISEIAQVIRGVSFDKGEVVDQARAGYLPILRAGNIRDDLLIDSDLVWVPEKYVSTDQRLRAGDIAICMSSGSQSIVGKSATLSASWSGSVGAFCAIIRPIPKRVMPEFLSYFLQSESFRSWTRLSSGANIKNIRKSELEQFEIPIPTFDRQRQVVDLISRAAGIVRLRREAQKKAAEIIPALFLDIFGDPVRNPKGWIAKPLGQLVDVISGGTPPKSVPEFWRGAIPWVSPKDMKVAVLNDVEDHISELAVESSRLQKVSKDAVLIVVRGMILAHSVPVAVCSRSMVFNQDIKALRTRKSLKPEFLAWQLRVRKSELLKLIDTSAHGTRKFDTSRLIDVPIIVPPDSAQDQFVHWVCQLYSVEAQTAIAIEIARKAAASLLGNAFGDGDARVCTHPNL